MSWGVNTNERWGLPLHEKGGPKGRGVSTNGQGGTADKRARALTIMMGCDLRIRST